MNRLKIIIACMIWILWMVLISGRVYAAITNKPQVNSVNNTTTSNVASVRYENDLFYADIKNVPLGKILNELEAKSGMKIILNDPIIANKPKSAKLEGFPLVDSIKSILEGFSYVLYPSNSSFVAIVLSSHGSSNPIPTARSGDTSYSQENVAHELLVHYRNEEIPQSLDQFQPIIIEESLFNKDRQHYKEVDPSRQLAIKQEYDESLLNRAIHALNSEHKHLHEEAIHQLANIDDARATEVLVEATRSDADEVSRAIAVDALWQHAVNLQFSDETSINALEQLVGDSDESVNRIARRALIDIQSAAGVDSQ